MAEFEAVGVFENPFHSPCQGYGSAYDTRGNRVLGRVRARAEWEFLFLKRSLLVGGAAPVEFPLKWQ
jgi:hypothetical protein